MPAVDLVGVGKRFGDGSRSVLALEPIDLAIEPEEIVALVGPSGCGKTTLLRTIAGLTKPSEGEVTVDGRSVWVDGRPNGAALDHLAVVFQEANLLPWMTVEANVAPAAARARRRARRAARPGRGAVRADGDRRLRTATSRGALDRDAATRRDRAWSDRLADGAPPRRALRRARRARRARR